VKQAQKITANLKKEIDVTINPNKEIIALIAYLQRLGTDIKNEPESDETVAQN